VEIDILTLFPEMFESVLGASTLRIAVEKDLVRYRLTDIREYSTDRHKKVDDKPFGGGPGMVLRPEPVYAAVEAVEGLSTTPATRVLLTPQGEPFSQEIAKELSGEARLMLICGRYEGFDERIRAGLGARELSVGPYVLSGGEVAAMVVVDAVVRLIPGVLGDEQSTVEESFENGLLEYPQYTRPREFRGMEVPEVLLSGDHARIAAWRQEESRKRTEKRRKSSDGQGA
jgi:tRNA (guanine37-N1)-methyltransferase